MDNSRNHREKLLNRLHDLEKILVLNEKALIEYSEIMTEESVGIIRSQNALVALEIKNIKDELGA